MVQEERPRTGTTIGSPTGITSRLDELTKRLEEQEHKEKKKEEKTLKIPKIGLGKLKKNYVLLVRLKTNQQMVMERVPIEDDMIYLRDNDTYHSATTDCVWRYKGLPVMILPEWSLQPINPTDLFEKSVTNKELVLPQRALIKAIELSQIKKKKKGNIWLIVGIIIAIVAIVFVLSQVLKKKAA